MKVYSDIRLQLNDREGKEQTLRVNISGLIIFSLDGATYRFNVVIKTDMNNVDLSYDNILFYIKNCSFT